MILKKLQLDEKAEGLKVNAPLPQSANFNELQSYRLGSKRSIRQLLAAAGISFPLVFGATAVAGSPGCGIDLAGTLGPDDASDAETADETSMAEASWTPDANDANEVEVDADAGDVTDGGVDSPVDTGVDAGPTATFSTTAGENECIHWLVTDGGVTQAFASDNHICEPKPIKGMPIKSGEDIYVWSKHMPSNNKIRFAIPLGATNYYTKCSTYSNPPDKAEMQTDLGNGGYVATSNSVALPNVELTNGGCPNGAAYIIHVGP